MMGMRSSKAGLQCQTGKRKFIHSFTSFRTERNPTHHNGLDFYKRQSDQISYDSQRNVN